MNDIPEFDAIVIGAGAGGGVAACVLAEAGKHVLLLERGKALQWKDVSRDHLRNHRLGTYGHNTGPVPADNPRVGVETDGLSARVALPHEGPYQNNAVTVGGGTAVYGAQAWRFMPDDFRMASLYGTPEGSSLVDWPISYEDLAPDYERAEWELGVAGDSEASARVMPRRRGFPLPAVADNVQRQLFGSAAERLGWRTAPVPLLINTVPYNGRPACVQCGMCVGFMCPSDGKTGTQNTVVPRALATGRCTLVTEAMAAHINTNEQGVVTGVDYFVGDKRQTARAKVVVCSAGAIETARLLLNSKSDREPDGLGNNSDQVGRHLQGHYYPGALGRFKNQVTDNVGPGVSISTTQFNHGNANIIGGGMLANEFTKLPMIFWHGCFPPRAKRWGLEAKQHMRDNYLRIAHIQGPVQEIPSPLARVSLDPHVRDRWGIPVARLSGATHSETVRTAVFMSKRADDWLKAAGAEQTWRSGYGQILSGGQHQAGTARMGKDPANSVTDGSGRVHGHENLFVADGSLHPTNGGFNPVLTILAMAYRVSSKVLASR